jgi:two-component system NtrC family sensor kinase
MIPSDVGQPVSDEQYRLITETTYDWELWLGPDREIRYCSPSCERITGYRPEEFYQDPALLANIVHPDERTHYDDHVVSGFSSSRPCALEYRIVTRRGEPRWLSHVCQPIHDAEGRWLGRRVSNRDITDRVQAEEAFRTLVEHSLQGLFIFQGERIVYANPAAERMTGYTVSELLTQDAKRLAARIHPDDRPLVLQRLRARLAGGSPPSHYNLRFTRKDGALRWWEIHATRVAYRGQPSIQIALLDITERVQVEEEIRRSAERHRQRSAALEALHGISLRLNAQLATDALLTEIVDQATMLLDAEAGCVFTYDEAGDQLVVTVGNDYMRRALGLRIAPGVGLAGRAFQTRQALTVDDYARWEKRSELYEREGFSFHALLAVPLSGPGGVLGVLNIARTDHQPFDEQAVWLAELFAAQAATALENARLYSENSRLLRMESEQRRRLQESHEQLVRVEKIAALGRLAAALAHEVNNPLQAIQSHLELVMDFPVSPEQQREFLEVIRHEIARLNEIAQRVLNFARPAVMARRRVALAELVNHTLALAGKQLQRNRIAVAVSIPDTVHVLVGPDQMVQVFLNLIINAVEAIGSDGCIEITAVERPSSCRSAELAADQEAAPGVATGADANAGDGTVAISFADDGRAIALEHLPHLFEPFFTTKPDGTGLGLAVSQNLVEQYGGTLTAANRPTGRGAIFTVCLPQSPQKIGERRDPN